MLKLTKKGDKYWLFEDSQIGLFSPSKFTINLELNEIVIVYENGLKSKRYNVSDCEIYDLGELTPFTTSSGDLFMQKLEELNCPCFQKNENIFNIYEGGGNWGEIEGTLSDQTDLQTALNGKQNSLGFTPENVSNKENTTLDTSTTKYPTNRIVKEVTDLKLDKVSTTGVERAYIINADGSQSTKATSEFGGKRTWMLSFTGVLYFDGTSGNGNWLGLNATSASTFGLLGGTSGTIFQTPVGTGGLPNAQSPARVIPYNCKIKSFHIRNGVSPFSAVSPANFRLRFHTHTPNGTTTLNNPVLQASFDSTGFNMPANYVYPSSCFTNNNLTLQAGDVITPIMRGLQALTAGALISDFYLEFEEI